MLQSQPKDLKSLFGTLVAHARPRARGKSGQSVVQRASNLDTGLNATGTILQLAKDAGDAVNQVPYVKAIAGILSQVIKIRDEIRVNKERCNEIIDLVQLKTTTILQALETVYRASGSDSLEDLKHDLEAYADFLRDVLRNELEPFKSHSRWMSYANRGKNAGDLQKIERHLDEFKDRFSVKRLVAISVDARNAFTLMSNPIPPPEIIPQALPPSPKLIIGRESTVENLVHDILSSSEPRVVILGSGGIGKTTVGTSVLHDPRITATYPTKYFVSTELAPTAELLENRIADALVIPQSGRGSDLVSQIVDRIRRDPHHVLLYLDNLETVWEVEAEQPKVDQFLDILSGAGNKLALLVAMRGTQEPKTSFPWDPTVLLGLDMPKSIAVYEQLSRLSVDAPARDLLERLSGSPLAIKLFALMVKEGDRPSQLLASWNEQGAKVLEIGGKHRLSSLEQSIRLSFFSPRIDDSARLVLELIALMPDGLSTSSPWYEVFTEILPDRNTLQPALRALKRTALLNEEGNPSRWQMLPPIRQFCLQLIDSTSSAVKSLVERYIDILSEHWDFASPASQGVIVPEMANIRGLLIYSCNSQPVSPNIGRAGVGYAKWAFWLNIDDQVILSSCLSSPIPTHDRAAIHLRLGIAHERWYRLDAAKASFSCALELYEESKDRVGEANSHYFMGEFLVRRDQLDAAQLSFSRALDLYISVHDQLGEASACRSIGNLCLYRDQLDEAEVLFSRSLELCRLSQSRLGEEYTQTSIGDLQMRRDRLDAAEMSFIRALDLSREIQDRMGEAHIHEFLGDLSMRRDHLDAADASFVCALQIYDERQNRWGQANVHHSIGGLHMRRDWLDAAYLSFNCALELYERVQNKLGIATTHQSLGEFYLRRDQLEEAESSFLGALEYYVQVQDRAGEASTQKSIGDLQIRRDILDAAERSYIRSLECYVQIQDQLGEANTHQSIGSLQMRRDHLDSAETSFGRAMKYYEEIQDQLYIASCTLSRGRVYLRRKDLNAADVALSRALTIWQEIGDSWGIAETHQAFGDLHILSDRLDDAKSSLDRALDIYTTRVESRTDEALTYRSIGELHLCRVQFDDCEHAFRRALELETAANSRVGQGQSHWGLGKLFYKKGDLAVAEASYSEALRLFLEIDDYQANPCFVDLGKVWVLQGKMEENESPDVGLLRVHWNATQPILSSISEAKVKTS